MLRVLKGLANWFAEYEREVYAEWGLPSPQTPLPRGERGFEKGMGTQVLTGEMVITVPLTEFIFWRDLQAEGKRVELLGAAWEVDEVDVLQDSDLGHVVEVALVWEGLCS